MNPQKDHVIGRAKQRLINPRIDTSSQLTVVQETGKAQGGMPARPHTVATFHDPQSDVRETRRLRQLGAKDWTSTSFEAEVVTPSLQSRYRAGYAPNSVHKAALDQLGSMFEVDQPNRAANASSPDLDWKTPAPPDKGPAVDPKTGKVVVEPSAPKSVTVDPPAKPAPLNAVAAGNAVAATASAGAKVAPQAVGTTAGTPSSATAGKVVGGQAGGTTPGTAIGLGALGLSAIVASQRANAARAENDRIGEALAWSTIIPGGITEVTYAYWELLKISGKMTELWAEYQRGEVSEVFRPHEQANETWRPFYNFLTMGVPGIW